MKIRIPRSHSGTIFQKPWASYKTSRAGDLEECEVDIRRDRELFADCRLWNCAVGDDEVREVVECYFYRPEKLLQCRDRLNSFAIVNRVDLILQITLRSRIVYP